MYFHIGLWKHCSGVSFHQSQTMGVPVCSPWRAHRYDVGREGEPAWDKIMLCYCNINIHFISNEVIFFFISITLILLFSFQFSLWYFRLARHIYVFFIRSLIVSFMISSLRTCIERPSSGLWMIKNMNLYFILPLIIQSFWHVIL